MEEGNNLYNDAEAIDENLVQDHRNKFNSMDVKRRKELEASLGWLFLTDNIKKRTREKIQNSMRFNDGLTLMFAIIGVFTNIIASVMYMTFEEVRGN
jgi:hypothetical protein